MSKKSIGVTKLQVWGRIRVDNACQFQREEEDDGRREETQKFFSKFGS